MIPLVSWIYLLLSFIVLLPLLFISFGRNQRRYPEGPEGGKEEIAAPARSRKVLRTIFRVLYYFLILALVAMISLEIARLVDAQLGIGLLPFLYPAYIFAAGFRAVVDFKWVATGRKYGVVVKVVNELFWLMLIVVFAIKVGAYSLQGLNSRDGRSPVDNYKVVDEVTDVGVMIGVALVLAVMEVFW